MPFPCSRKTRSTASASRMSESSTRRSGCAARNRSVTWAVEASGLKKRARMSFSIPTTSKPAAVKWATASEPIRPPEPVTIATGIGLGPFRRWGVDFQRLGDPLLVDRDPIVDVRQHLLGAAAWTPLVEPEELPAVGKVYGNIAGAGLCHRLDRHLVAGQSPADLGRLAQREAALAA